MFKEIFFGILFIIIVLISFTFGNIANSRNYTPGFIYDLDETVNADIHRWISSAQMPDTLMSCCGESDLYLTDGLHVDDKGQMFTRIDDDRDIVGRTLLPKGTVVYVPPNKLDTKHQSNPMQQDVIFMNPGELGVGFHPNVYCYFQVAGG